MIDYLKSHGHFLIVFWQIKNQSKQDFSFHFQIPRYLYFINIDKVDK